MEGMDKAQMQWYLHWFCYYYPYYYAIIFKKCRFISAINTSEFYWHLSVLGREVGMVKVFNSPIYIIK